MPPVDAQQRIRSLVARELSIIANAGRRAALTQLLIAPRQEDRMWNYGQPGERHSYWVVAEDAGRGTILVYSEHGFGPAFPWGFLPLDGPDSNSLGMDAQWNWYLEEAFVRSGLWGDPANSDEPWHLSPEERFPRGRDV